MEKRKKLKKRKIDSNEKLDWKQEVKSWGLTILSAVAIVVFLQCFVIVNANIPSGSMESTIMVGDRVIAGRFAYWFDTPERGDVVIFRYPDHEATLYVKRVIGLPGDKIEIENGKVYLNNSEVPLEEDYLSVVPHGDFGPYVVPEGSYFMMGDNRNDSWDSRFWTNTFVKENKILGKVYFSYFPKIKKIQ